MFTMVTHAVQRARDCYGHFLAMVTTRHNSQGDSSNVGYSYYRHVLTMVTTHIHRGQRKWWRHSLSQDVSSNKKSAECCGTNKLGYMRPLPSYLIFPQTLCPSVAMRCDMKYSMCVRLPLPWSHVFRLCTTDCWHSVCTYTYCQTSHTTNL